MGSVNIDNWMTDIATMAAAAIATMVTGSSTGQWP